MKKGLFLCMMICMSISLFGCSSGSSKDAIKKTIEEKGYSISINVKDDIMNNYKEDTIGTCYSDNQEVKCSRIIKSKSNYDTVLLSKEDKQIWVFLSDDKVNRIIYNFFLMTYTYDTNENAKYVYFNPPLTECIYIFEGKKDDIICDESYKERAENLRKEYTDLVKGMGLDEEELLEFLNDYAKDEVKTISSKVKDNYKKQEPLDIIEIEEILNYNFNIETTDGGYTLKINDFYKKFDESNIVVSYDKGTKKLTTLTYYDRAYSGKINDDTLVYVYYPQTGKEIGMSRGTACAFDLVKKEDVGNAPCSKSQKDNSYSLQSQFPYLLNSYEVSIDEFILYLTSISPSK